jgi:hypothetical protein
MNSQQSLPFGILGMIEVGGGIPKFLPSFNFDDDNIKVYHPVHGVLSSSEASDETAAAIGVLGLLVHEHDVIVDKALSIVDEIETLSEQASRRFTVNGLLGRPRTEPQQIDAKEGELKTLDDKVGVLDTAIENLSGLIFQLDAGLIDAEVFDTAVSRLNIDYLEIKPIAGIVRATAPFDSEDETAVQDEAPTGA